LFAPAAPGAYEVRAFYREDETILRGSVPFTVAGEATAVVPAGPSTPSPDARATLTIDKMVYAPGETITIGFSGMFGAHDDYVCTAPAGSTNWTYLSYKYTQGVREGALTLVAPTAPGDYEIRAFYREDESILRGSVPFTVR